MTGCPIRSRAPVLSRHSGACAFVMFEFSRLVAKGGFGPVWEWALNKDRLNRQQSANEDDSSGEITPN